MHASTYPKNTYSRYLSGHNGEYDSRQVYGPSSNHITSRYKSSYDVLPSKTKGWDTNKRYSAASSGLYSPGYQQQVHSSYNSNSRKASPTRANTTSKRSIENNNGMIRPAMRDKTNRHANGSFSSITPPTNAKPSVSSTTHATYRARESSLQRGRHSPSISRRPNSSNDLTASTLNNVTDKPLGMPPRNSAIKLNKSTSFSSKPKEEISIDDHPYKDTAYKPSFVSARTPSPKQLPKPTNKVYKVDGNGITGLRNIGNTCFMNSILQCLSNTKRLRDYCLASDYVKELNHFSSMKGKLMKAFSQLITDLWSGSSTSVTPSNFKAQIQAFSPRFMGYEQQDSQEFLRFLLEGLHEEINQVQKKSSEPLKEMTNTSPQEIARETWKWYGKKDKSFVFDLFVGQLESKLECSKCGYVSLTYDPFWDLSLPISKNSTSIGSASLDDCLKNFTKEETLDGDEKPTCAKCKTRRKMKKKLSIHRFPKILVIHLKRFNERSRYRQKLSNLVTFPVQNKLKLTNYSTETSEDKNLSSYDLYAVSNHCGSCYGGHYTAFCWNSHLKGWYQFNDSRVSSISPSSVCTKEAYVLFYAQQTSCGVKSSRL